MSPEPAGGPRARGALIAVVGASGVGKDALIVAAAEAEATRGDAGPRASFPRRVITRPAGPGEDHEPMSDPAFAAARERGAFAVSWTAHGLAYGIPASIEADLAAGRPVVVNVSRAVLSQLADRYDRLVVVRVTVDPAVRAARLRGRGRESGPAVAERLERPDPDPDFPADVEIVNDGTIREGGRRLADVIRAAAG